MVDEKKAASYGLIRPEALAVYFSDVPSMLPDFTAAMGTDDEGNACVVLSYDEMIEHYGIRVYYTAAETNGTVRPLPLDGTGKVSYRKGDIIYPPGSGAGYLEKSYLYGLDDLTDLRFIVIRTSSEGGNFHMMGKSPIVGLE